MGRETKLDFGLLTPLFISKQTGRLFSQQNRKVLQNKDDRNIRELKAILFSLQKLKARLGRQNTHAAH